MLATRKGASREGWSEGSVVQNRDPTNRNRIRGRLERTSVRRNAKSISVKALACTSGGCAAKVVELTSGDLHGCPESRTREAERQPACRAEVSKGQKRCADSSRGPNGARTEAFRVNVEW